MGSKTTTTQESKPPAWATPLFEKSAKVAGNLYDSGAGGNVYQGSTVSPLSNTTMSGVNQLANAGQNWNTAGTRPLYQGLGAAAVSDPTSGQLSSLAGGIKPGQVGTSGYDPAQSAATGIGSMAQNLLGGIASGKDGINTEADWRGILERAQDPTSAASNLSGYASGDYLKGEGNPFYRERLESELADTAAQVRSSMSGMGRYGSDVSNRTLASELGKQRTAGLEDDFNRQTQNQFNAVGMIDAANQAALGQQAGAASGISGVQGQNLTNRLGAGNSMIGAQSDMTGQLRGIADSRAGIQAGNADRMLSGQALQGNLLSQAGQFRGAGLDRASGLADSISGLDQRNFQNQLTGAGATLQAGGMMDSQSQKQLMDEVNKFYELDNADWQRLGLLQASASGAAGPYGTQSGTSRTSNPGAVLGSLMGGAK